MQKRLLLITLSALFFSFLTHAQVLPRATVTRLDKMTDSLSTYSLKVINGRNSSDRLAADSVFTKVFVRALRTTNSFEYPFDSLLTISKIYAPDSSFRIFTWQLEINDNLVRQHGAIQMHTADGSLKLFPLIDKSDITTNIMDTIGDNMGWMGAVYYRIIPVDPARKLYTLLGFDEYNVRSSRKIIEMLDMSSGKPVFGGRFFNMKGNPAIKTPISRYVMEFKKDTGPRLTFDPEMNMIIMEHLVSESNQPLKKYTLIGDGDYEGFTWKDGKWNYVNKIFNEVTPEGLPPVPTPIRADNGDIDNSKLKGRENEAPVTPKKKP